jgi:predicted CoA-binding protein
MTEDLSYDDDYIRGLLRRSRTIAMVGASPNWNRPSFFVMKYLQRKGFRMIPVNPVAAGQEILGETVHASLKDIGEPIDIVNIFRRSEEAGPITDEAIEVGAKTVWMQIGVRNDAAGEKARKAGLDVVMNRCPKIEYSRLCGELSWLGMNSHVISSKRRRI